MVAATGGEATSQRTGIAKEFDYYLANQDALVERYNGKVIVIKHGEVLGAYNSHIQAVIETQKAHELGTFLVQLVSPGTEAYTHTFHSRVMKL
jgi:hypothetical protein